MSSMQRSGRVNEHDRSRMLWSGRQRRTYRVGLLALLGGLAVALIPPAPAKGAPGVTGVSGAIQIAGSVKARKATRHATSDWMEIEKQRGISVASSVMQMLYRAFGV